MSDAALIILGTILIFGHAIQALRISRLEKYLSRQKERIDLRDRALNLQAKMHDGEREAFRQSEQNVEQLRVHLVVAREELAVLEPRRTQAEAEAHAEEQRRRQEFLDDCVVRGRRWGDLTEDERKFCSGPSETVLLASIQHLTNRIEKLRGMEPVTADTVPADEAAI